MRKTKCSILNPNLERQRVMKKIYMAMAVIAAAVLSSCEREKDFGGLTPLGENDIAFTLQNAATRSMEAVSETSVQTGVTIPMGSDGKGNSFYLEESIEELNPTPATKGAPAYTENLGSVYTTMGVYAEGNFGDNAYVLTDKEMHANPNGGNGWRFHHSYSSSPWPDEETPVDFFLRMPAADAGVQGTIEYDTTNKTFELDYKSPLVATSQKDFLLAYTSLSKEDHDGYLPKGAPVMMYHALTGVKFRTGHPNQKTTHTVIKSVKFKGLKATGHLVATVDTKDNSITMDWQDQGTTGFEFTQEFTNPDYTYTKDDDGNVTVTSSDGSYDYTADDGFGASWTSAAADKNLNVADGSMTFWFIPQQLNGNVELEVTFCVKTPDTPKGTDITHTISFGDSTRKITKDDEGNVTDIADYPTWKAGQLRTYTLMPLDVDVDIFDELNGWTKENLHVTNTGNVDEYVRMMLVGNWYDGDGNILVGYKTDGSSEHTDAENAEMVVPWYREADEYKGGFDETFENGKPNADAGNEWIFGTGSYFYYPEVIGAGDKLAQTSALFQSYTLDDIEIPTIYLPSATSNVRQPAQGVHLVMEVVVQAISSINPETGQPFAGWEAAWSYATGKEIKEKN